MRNNRLDTQYLNIAQNILDKGTYKVTRNGNVYSTFCQEMRHSMDDGFPILTTKKMSLKNVFTELKWFMLGRTDLRFLLERKCNIWNGDAHKNYLRYVKKIEKDFNESPILWKYFNLEDNENGSDTFDITEHLLYKDFLRKSDDGEVRGLTEEEFVEKVKTDDEFNEAFGDLGPIYGAQWLNFNGEPKNYSELGEDVMGNDKRGRGFNQIQMILDLLSKDPDSRRIRVTAWNPTVLDEIALPSCHTDFQCYTEENENLGSGLKRKLSLMFSCRSQDFFLGTPYNTASYGLLLMILSAILKYEPNELIHRMGDTHIYEGHLDAIKTQLGNSGHKLPQLKLKGRFLEVDDYWCDGEFNWIEFIEGLEWDADFELIDYKNDGNIKAPLFT